MKPAASRIADRLVRKGLGVWGACTHRLQRLAGRRPRPCVCYIVSRKLWSVKQDGLAIMTGCRKVAPGVSFEVSAYAEGLHDTVIHFGSSESFQFSYTGLHPSNRFVTTLFHGFPEMHPSTKEGIEYLLKNIDTLERIVVSCSLMKRRFLEWGAAESKIAQIPLGVSLSLFHPVSPDQRAAQRRRLGIPEDRFCIGSFQKDGNGWGEGLEPKWAKAPDIFLAAVRRIAQKCPVFVLLTGPARGYVKRGLDEAGIPYRHEYFTDLDGLPAFYHALDLYLVTSREEGGPKAVLESMATGVPLLSTRVGMAPDIIEDGENALIVDVDDVDAIVDGSLRIFADRELGRRLIRNAATTVAGYDWADISAQYWQRVYAPALDLDTEDKPKPASRNS